MKNILWSLVMVVAVLTAVVVGFYVVTFAPGSHGHLSRSPEDWAKFGEYVGGTLGAVFGLVAFAGVLITIGLSREANRETRQAHMNELRPWVTLTANLSEIPSYHGGNEGWRFVLAYALTNVGKSPARRVQLHVKVIPWMLEELRDGVSLPGTRIATELNAFAKAHSKASATMAGARFGNLLFPEERWTGTYQANRGDAPFVEALVAPNYTGQLIVLVCAVYQSTIDDSWHETAQGYSLFISHTPQGAPQKIQLVNGEFNVLNLGFTVKPHTLSDSYAS